MKATIRTATLSDAGAITGIYNHYILNTVVTFEEQAIKTADIRKRMKQVAGDALPWLVAESEGSVVGYAYASKWKGRCAYRFSVESTVYLAEAAVGRGIGSGLYGVLLAELRKRKLHVAVGGIALPNEASVRLHEKFGFEKTAYFKEIGYKFEKWIDVGYWQVTL
ncbi:MAG: phosphinothricin acetyltransferase [Elusimicrobia bacterium CG11_big_fil_rev_8_21_14_0_20_64_6]|nr:MAG: phosphinothricin acetyltransferase [Elusimicrobia bacterium CG11_big_fil_rev_8_21_14_0_20_64_6]